MQNFNISLNEYNIHHIDPEIMNNINNSNNNTNNINNIKNDNNQTNNLK
eukprot:UN10045